MGTYLALGRGCGKLKTAMMLELTLVRIQLEITERSSKNKNIYKPRKEY